MALMIVIASLIGFVLGLIVSVLYIKRSKKIGNIVIDQSDPDGPYIFLELEDPNWREELKNRNEVVLNVIFKNYISQK